MEGELIPEELLEEYTVNKEQYTTAKYEYDFFVEDWFQMIKKYATKLKKYEIYILSKPTRSFLSFFYLFFNIFNKKKYSYKRYHINQNSEWNIFFI